MTKIFVLKNVKFARKYIMKQIIVITEDINKVNVNKLILVPKIYGAERDNNFSKRPAI